MTCKDCVHIDVCMEHYDCDEDDFRLCGDFKNKAEYIELPCRVGDRLYILNKNSVISEQIDERTVLYLIFEQNIIAVLDRGGIIEAEDFGKTVFLTREKVEEALKRRQNE